MSGKTPSVGRAVHYTTERTNAGESTYELATATITKVHPDGKVDLVVFPAFTSDQIRNAVVLQVPKVELTEAPAGTKEAYGKWSWPVYVP